MQTTTTHRTVWAWAVGLVSCVFTASFAQAITPPRMLSQAEIEQRTHLIASGQILKTKTVEPKGQNQREMTVWMKVSGVKVRHPSVRGLLKKGNILRFFFTCKIKYIPYKPTKPTNVVNTSKPPKPGQKMPIRRPRLDSYSLMIRRLSTRYCRGFRSEGASALLKKKGSKISIRLALSDTKTHIRFITVVRQTGFVGPVYGHIHTHRALD